MKFAATLSRGNYRLLIEFRWQGEMKEKNEILEVKR